MVDRAVKLDRLAELLAAKAGVVWRDLSDYPGYLKGRWRDQARSVVGRSSPGVRFIAGKPQWDGSTSDELVCDLSQDFLELEDLGELS
jgi:hypothetical protein